jgi:hypothetical protein
MEDILTKLAHVAILGIFLWIGYLFARISMDIEEMEKEAKENGEDFELNIEVCGVKVKF